MSPEDRAAHIRAFTVRFVEHASQCQAEAGLTDLSVQERAALAESLAEDGVVRDAPLCGSRDSSAGGGSSEPQSGAAQSGTRPSARKLMSQEAQQRLIGSLTRQVLQSRGLLPVSGKKGRSSAAEPGSGGLAG